MKMRLAEMQKAFSLQMAANKARMDAETAEQNKAFEEMLAGVAATLVVGAANAVVEGGEGEGVPGEASKGLARAKIVADVGNVDGCGGEEKRGEGGNGEGGEDGEGKGGKGVGGKGKRISDMRGNREKEMQEDFSPSEYDDMPDVAQDRCGVKEREQRAVGDGKKAGMSSKGGRDKLTARHSNLTLIQHRDIIRQKEQVMRIQQVDTNKKSVDSEDEHAAVDKGLLRKDGAVGAGGAGGSGKGAKGVGGVCKKIATKADKEESEKHDVSGEEAGGSKQLTIVPKFNDPDVVTGEWVCMYCSWPFPPSTRQKALISTHMGRHHGMVLEDSEALKRERKKNEAVRKGHRLLEEVMRRRGEGMCVHSV